MSRRIASLLAVVAVGWVTAACGGDGESAEAVDRARGEGPAATPTTAATDPPPGFPPAADPDRPARIVTPGEDVPNPFVLIEDGTHLLYSSKSGPFAPNIALRRSDRLTQWGEPVDVLPDLPPWSEWGFTWAPDVRRFGDTYVL